jgi:CheY-like chemotaxis protein
MNVLPALRSRQARVLVVDDEPVVLQLIWRMLEAGGHRVYLAADGVQAIAALTEHAPIDVVVSDLRMPKLDGLSLSAMLAERSPPVPVMLMSGYVADLSDVAADTPLLVKPFTENQLLAGVGRLLARAGQTA